MDLLRRIRWGNVARAFAVVAALALLVLWPRLDRDPPALPPEPALASPAPAPVPGGDAVGEPRAEGERSGEEFALDRPAEPHASVKPRRSAKPRRSTKPRRSPKRRPSAEPRGSAKPRRSPRRRPANRPARRERPAPPPAAPRVVPRWVAPPPPHGEFGFE